MAADTGQPTPNQLELELAKLRLICQGIGNRRASERWPIDLPLEGWLAVDAGPSEPIPVELVDLSSGGVAVLLGAEPALQPGQRGRLITQAHGGGCGSRAVRCCWQRSQLWLQVAGLAFESATPG
ncbi:MAG: PilZ domain-containing protein [Cyanobacteriota bacterium]|nr:PilZ domain-containing protein [Cyanobacteriota bacterium]